MTFPLIFLKTNIRVITVIVSMILLIAALAFFAGYQLSKKTEVIKLQAQANQSLDLCHQQTEDLDHQLTQCIWDRGDALRHESNVQYDFNEFGISSPLFTPAAIFERNYYRYNKENIKSTHYQVDLEGITIWEWEHKNASPTVPQSYGMIANNYFPTFGGYENNAVQAIYVSELAKNWTKKDSFTTKEGITFFYTYEELPYRNTGVNLQAYVPYSAGGNPLFVEVRVTPSEQTDYTGSRTSKGVLQAKRRAKEIAEGISLQKK